MIRLLWIPVAGTLAALVVILLAHAPREDSPYPLETRPRKPPSRAADAEREAADLPQAGQELPGAPVPEDPAGPETWLVSLAADGSFEIADTEERFDDASALLERIAPESAPRPTVHLFSLSKAVGQERLEAAAERLRARCHVRIQSHVEEPE